MLKFYTTNKPIIILGIAVAAAFCAILSYTTEAILLMLSAVVLDNINYK